MTNGKEFLRRRREAFERFRAKRKEAFQIRQARASIKRQSVLGRTEQKIGIERKKFSGKLKIAREKAEVRKQQAELRKLRFESFRASRTGRTASFLQKAGAAGIRAARQQGAARRPIRRPIRRTARPRRVAFRPRRMLSRRSFRKKARRRPQRQGLFFE